MNENNDRLFEEVAQDIRKLKNHAGGIENNTAWVERKLDDLIKAIERQNQLMERLLNR